MSAAADDAEQRATVPAAAKKPRLVVDIALLEDSKAADDDDSASAAVSAGAIFAAARRRAAEAAEAAATAPSKSTSSDSTKPKEPAPPPQQPLPGVIRVPASAASSSSGSAAASGSRGSSALLVSRRQRGNPLLRCIRSVPWEFAAAADTAASDDSTPAADFVLSRTACAVFLSVRYHCLHPEYVHQRLKQLAARQQFDLRVLLLLVDTQEYSDAVRELNRICLLARVTLIAAWSNEEAARYLESYKSLEHKPADSLMERTADDWPGQLRDVLGCVRGVSRSDAACLAATFGTFEAISRASQAELERCPGLGPKKAARLRAALGHQF